MDIGKAARPRVPAAAVLAGLATLAPVLAGCGTSPPGAAAPTGRYLSMVVDARTFQGLDLGVGPNPPPVSPASLGPVTYLHVSRSVPAQRG
jgi:hypothetical protein